MDNVADIVSMLLSSEWFLPYWGVLGIAQPREDAYIIQKECRALVARFIERIPYWDADFSTARMEKTKSELLEIVSTRSETSARALAAVFQNTAYDHSASADPQLALSLCQLLVVEYRHNSELADMLPSNIAKAVEAAVKDNVRPNFASLCLESHDDWDIYLTSVTPDLPTYLADAAFEFYDRASQFELVWGGIEGRLNGNEVKALKTQLNIWAEEFTRKKVFRG